MMAVILLFSILFSSVLGGGLAPQSWYIRRAPKNAQPPLGEDMAYIEEYDAYYLDKKRRGEGDKVLYLTFDAGYENGNVEKILNILKEEKIPAAFFILDHLILSNESLVRRMGNEGHLVCNHTLRHRDMSKIRNEEEFVKELTSLERLYRERIGGEMAKYYRPPEGRFTEENLKYAQKNGYKTIFWSLAYADWDNKNQPTPEAAMEKLLKNTHDGAVVLLHPTSATNAAILRELCRTWRAMGYRFGTLDELTARETV